MRTIRPPANEERDFLQALDRYRVSAEASSRRAGYP